MTDISEFSVQAQQYIVKKVKANTIRLRYLFGSKGLISKSLNCPRRGIDDHIFWAFLSLSLIMFFEHSVICCEIGHFTVKCKIQGKIPVLWVGSASRPKLTLN